MPEPVKSTRTTTAKMLTCLECGRPWVDGSERWRIYVTTDEWPTLLLYCTVCATREFE